MEPGYQILDVRTAGDEVMAVLTLPDLGFREEGSGQCAAFRDDCSRLGDLDCEVIRLDLSGVKMFAVQGLALLMRLRQNLDKRSIRLVVRVNPALAKHFTISHSGLDLEVDPTP